MILWSFSVTCRTHGYEDWGLSNVAWIMFLITRHHVPACRARYRFTISVHPTCCDIVSIQKHIIVKLSPPYFGGPTYAHTVRQTVTKFCIVIKLDERRIFAGLRCVSRGTLQNSERDGSVGRIWMVTICGSLGPICGSVITVGLRLGFGSGLELRLGLGLQIVVYKCWRRRQNADQSRD